MSLHHSLSSPAPRRTSPLLVAGIAVGSFVIGGLATIGLISIPQLLRGTETAAVVAPSTIPMAPEATRAATPGLLDVTTPTVNAVATPEVGSDRYRKPEQDAHVDRRRRRRSVLCQR